MAASPAAPSVPVDHSPFTAALLSVPAAAAVAGVWKSATSRAGLPPNAPVRTSIRHAPRVVNGFTPQRPMRWSRSVADTIVAPSGITDVSNERIPLVCPLFRWSPTWRLVDVELARPPTPLVAEDSTMLPSWLPIERSEICTGPVPMVVVVVLDVVVDVVSGAVVEVLVEVVSDSVVV